MRVTVITLVVLAAWVSCSPIDPELRLVRRLRSPQYYGFNPDGTRLRTQRPQRNYLLKGEYWCATGICELEPGYIPRGCNGVCQHPVLPHPPPLP